MIGLEKLNLWHIRRTNPGMHGHVAIIPDMASAADVTSSPKPNPISRHGEDALMVPWLATGRIAPQDARLFAAAVVGDPALANDLASARAEYAAVSESLEALGRPSLRPLLALFTAIDEAATSSASNVVRFSAVRQPPQGACSVNAAIDPKMKFRRSH